MEILGIDVGGSGIKGAPVDIQTGKFTGARHRIPTPKPAKPNSVIKVISDITRHFDWHGPIGVGFPAALHNGVVLTASNIHKKWIGVNAAKIIAEKTGCPVCMVNDADAAGLAEITFGAGKRRNGVIVVVTIGTGLGTALFTDGILLPNAELGHIEIDGVEAEWRASDAARKRENLSWQNWGERFNIYLGTLEKLLYPGLFILGGGASKKFAEFIDYIDVHADVVPARLRNEAGIIGAALAARDWLEHSSML
jgi:polyphosphate glucokinase